MCFTLGVLLWLLPISSARAAGAAALVEWEAPESCPGALDVYERLRAGLGHELQDLGNLSRIRGSLVRTPSGYRLALEVVEVERKSSRLLESASCDDLVDAAVLAILLALSPEAAPEAVVAPELPPEGTSASRGAEPGAADVMVANEESKSARLRGFASASAVIELGALPNPALGVAFGAGARVGALSLGGYGVLLAAEQVAVRAATSVEFELWFAGARTCYAVLASALSLDACAGIEAGRFGALGLDLTAAKRYREPWLAPVVALAAQLALTGPLRIELRTEAALPLARRQYIVNGAESVHAPAVVSSRVYLGLSLSVQ